MKCPHDLYNGNSKEVSCVCSELEIQKNHMIFKTGKMSKDKMCPLEFGKIKTVVRDGCIIIKERGLK